MRDLFDDDNDDKGSSDFAQLFESSLQDIGKKLKAGDRIRGEILSIGKEEVFVSTGTVTDGVVLKPELVDKEGVFSHKVGDTLDLFVTQVRGGQIFLSPKPTSKNLAEGLEDAFDMMLPVEGRVTETCNGGFRVLLMGQTAFCPISQMDLKRIDQPETYIGKKFEFMVTQFDRRNVVVSRRKLLEEQKGVSQATFLEDHKVGDVVKGVVMRLEKFGAFIELAPGLEGLAHISELSWSRVANPAEAVQLGQEVDVKIIKMEEEAGRMKISVSVKQVEAHPWTNLPSHIEYGKIVEGKVTRCMKFGAFVEVAPGIEGLIPLGEMSYTKRVMSSDELFKEGEKILVMIKEVRPDDRRISLSLRDAGSDPWAMVPVNFAVGTIVKGRVERREPYGLFVKLDEGITGLLPKSKAMENGEFPYDKIKVGDDVTVQVAEVRQEERKLSLQVPADPDAEAWRGFSAPNSGAGAGKNLGTLGDQFKMMFEQKQTTAPSPKQNPKQNPKKK